MPGEGELEGMYVQGWRGGGGGQNNPTSAGVLISSLLFQEREFNLPV